jgi:hypothetical protein
LRVVVAGLAVMFVSTGCWEQWSVTWWPQMKWQKAVQAFEQTDQPSAPAGFVPPEGTIPFGKPAQTSQMPLAETECWNPRAVSLANLETARSTSRSSADRATASPVSATVRSRPSVRQGPFLGVLPIAARWAPDLQGLQRRAHLHGDFAGHPSHAELQAHPFRHALGHRELRPVPQWAGPDASPDRTGRDAAAGSHAVSTAVVTAEQANPRVIPRAWLGACLALVAIGVAAFAGGIATDPATAWRAFHVNYLYFGALAQGGVVVACAFVIIGAKWPGPVRRIAEGLGAWAPLTFVLFLVDFLGREYIYTNWINGPPPARPST